MKIYYKENTGLKTPQEYNTDNFGIKLIYTDYDSNNQGVDLVFWDNQADAISNKIPRLCKRVEWSMITELSNQNIISNILSVDTLVTTTCETITLKDAVLV